jgi:PH (Pleckstrin Homology) domain-containing protein
VPAYASTFEAAPLDRTARIATRTMWAAAAASVVAGGAVAALGSGWSGLLLVMLGAFLVVMLAWMRRIEPRSYDVGDGLLQVRRRSASASSFSGTISDMRRGRLGLRVFGDGGAYGYLGRFRADGRAVRAFVTDRQSVVLLDVGGASLALSPRDPDRFVAEVGRGR